MGTSTTPHPIKKRLTVAEINRLLQRLNTFKSTPQQQVFDSNNTTQKQYQVFFDGTDNDAKDITKPTTVIGQLANVADVLTDDPRKNGNYYNGPGNEKGRLDAATGKSVDATVQTAYDNLVAWANRPENLGADIRIGAYGFSRGGLSARAFLNLLDERGIPSVGANGLADPDNPIYLREPRSNTPTLLCLVESVGGPLNHDAARQAIPANPNLVVCNLLTLDERRAGFIADSVQNASGAPDPRINEVWLDDGAHADLGGGYTDGGGITIAVGSALWDIAARVGFRSRPLAPELRIENYEGDYPVHNSYAGFANSTDPNLGGPEFPDWVLDRRAQAETYLNPPVRAQSSVPGPDQDTADWNDFFADPDLLDYEESTDDNGNPRVVLTGSKGVEAEIFVDGLAIKRIDYDYDTSNRRFTQSTATTQTDDDGNTTTVTQTPDGSESIETKAADGTLISRIIDTPTPDGGMGRVFETTVDGNLVTVNQHASKADIDEHNKDPGRAVDFDTDEVKIGDAVYSGNSVVGAYWDDVLHQYTTQSISGSQGGDGNSGSNASSDATYSRGFPDIDPNAPDVRMAAGAGVPSGVGAGFVPTVNDWLTYNFNNPNSRVTDTASALAGIIKAAQSGSPSAFVRATFSAVATFNPADPVVGDIGQALGFIDSGIAHKTVAKAPMNPVTRGVKGIRNGCRRSPRQPASQLAWNVSLSRGGRRRWHSLISVYGLPASTDSQRLVDEVTNEN